ncbi:hypothetical protein GGR42_002708 [Saonia flava]|uniref:Uncharacterized protein n=1 Tax=Saonia flava TaxID=523696 RepID=A0A846QYD6_9FLAO|nr:hypothetical protein [Saonia flava]
MSCDIGLNSYRPTKTHSWSLTLITYPPPRITNTAVPLRTVASGTNGIIDGLSSSLVSWIAFYMWQLV